MVVLNGDIEMTIKRIHSAPVSEVAKILNEAITEDFDFVFVIGEKDGQLFLKSSATTDRIKTLGYLTEMQHHMIKAGE